MYCWRCCRLLHLVCRLYGADHGAAHRHGQPTLLELLFGALAACFSGSFNGDGFGHDGDVTLRRNDIWTRLPVLPTSCNGGVTRNAAYGRGCCGGAGAFLVQALLLFAHGKAHTAAGEHTRGFTFAKTVFACGVGGRFYRDVVLCGKRSALVADDLAAHYGYALPRSQGDGFAAQAAGLGCGVLNLVF